MSWFERAADGNSSGSSLENGNGDVYTYYPDGSLGEAYRNVNSTGGWPTAQQGTDGKGDSQVALANPSPLDAVQSTVQRLADRGWAVR